jgi:UrcA family protein
MKTTVFLLAAVCLAAGYAAHSAEPRDSALVRYSELDVSRQQSATELVGRIRQAAQTVCGPRPSILTLADHDRYGACLNEAGGSAVERLDSPLVRAAYKMRASRLAFSRP